MSTIQVERVPALKDNYIWVVHDPTNGGITAVVDPAEAQPVEALLQQRSVSTLPLLLA